MPNVEPRCNHSNRNNDNEVSTTPNTFENHLLSIRDERQRMIYPNCHPTYNERHQKIIELIDWTLEKYNAAVDTKKMNEQNEQIIIDDIIQQLNKKRDIAIHKKKQAQLKDDVS